MHVDDIGIKNAKEFSEYYFQNFGATKRRSGSVFCDLP
jgi:hypothetical protein